MHSEVTDDDGHQGISPEADTAWLCSIASFYVIFLLYCMMYSPPKQLEGHSSYLFYLFNLCTIEKSKNFENPLIFMFLTQCDNYRRYS